MSWRGGVTGIAGKEGVGGDQRRRVDAVDQLGDLPIMQRRRIEIDLHAGRQAEQ